MVRILAFLVGLFFSGWLLVTFGVGLVSYISEPPAATAEHEFHKDPRTLALKSDGPFGKFDRQQLQRGFQVYKEVCSACHSLRLVHFRNFEALGYNEDEVKAIAANWAIPSPAIDPDTGEASTRPSLPADPVPSPYANEVAARAANNNALPPDLSLITKARHGGASYVYSLLTGYQDPPKELAKEFPDAMPGTGLHYNPYFANLNIAMAPPLADGQVTFADGSPSTREQAAKDVAAFLVWTAEPTLEKRHQTGWAVLIFLLIATVLGYMAYRNVWADKKH
ncbi:MAG: cytochrome c1 [Blastomonas sp.]